jgi:hypothetical protein
MKSLSGYIFLVAALSALALSTCGCGSSAKVADEPYFQTRGVVVAWDDVCDTAAIDWVKLIKENGLNTISVCGHDYQSPEYLAFKQRCADNGIYFEYEDHMMTWLLPKDLYSKHPEYFRMDTTGKRVADYNGCPSSQGALDEVTKNAAKYAKLQYSTNHRYYFWLYDGGDVCHCDKCKNYNPADQAVLFENAIIKGLKQIDPDAKLSHLCYYNTTAAPAVAKPDPDIFLLFAPFYRRWDKPLSDRSAIRDGEKISHGQYLDYLEANLKVFPAETAQVLEYWMDVSQRSGWKKPAVRLDWHKDVFLKDLQTYASYGIRNVSAYAVFVDANYVKAYKDLQFVKDYGEGLRDFRLPDQKSGKQ